MKCFNYSFSVFPIITHLFSEISSKQLHVVLIGSECPVTLRIPCKFSSLYCFVKTPWKNYGTWSSSWWTSFTWLSGYSNFLNRMLKVPCLSLFFKWSTSFLSADWHKEDISRFNFFRDNALQVKWDYRLHWLWAGTLGSFNHVQLCIVLLS